MAHRPYFNFGIDQIQSLVSSSKGDLNALKAIQHELSFRRVPKAKGLKAEVDDLVRQFAPESEVPVVSISHAPIERVVVECANCNSPIFISTLESVVQHLSCPACKSLCKAEYKYGVMRTTFQSSQKTGSGKISMQWILISLVVLVMIALIAK